MSVAAPPVPGRVARRRLARAVGRLELSPVAWLGLMVAVGCVLVGLLGPMVAPYDPDAFVGAPLSAPSSEHLLGLDYLGRDAWSRFLFGGRTAILLALLGFLAGASVGLTLGLLAAYSRGIADRIVDRTTEILVGFPSLVLMLLLVAGLGSELWVIVLALAVVHFPRVARIVRAAGIDVRHMAYVEVAEARGERHLYVMFREMLPAVMPPFLVDAGIRIPASILLVASLSFLGLGIQPPASDWGLIISENRAGLTSQPWAAVAPITALAALMIGVNVAIDGFQRVRSLSARRSVD
ncbi:MAG: ABC transporter permease [Solirubrobacteraceae bacterium]